MKLSEKLIVLRKESGWSQEDFADKLGTTPTYVSNLENAKRNTRIDYIDHIATVLDVELFQLFVKRENIENRRIPRR